MTTGTSLLESLLHGDATLTAVSLLAIFLACPAVLMRVVPHIPVVRTVTFVPFLFLVPMLLSSAGIIPADAPLYAPLQSLMLSLAIFFMVVAIDVGCIVRSLDARVLLLFLAGCLGTCAGAALAHVLCRPLLEAEQSAMVAACTAATYSGGAINWVAVSEALGVPGTLTATAFPATVIVYAVYLAVLLAVEQAPFRPALDRWLGADRRPEEPPPPWRPEAAAAIAPADVIDGFLAFCVVFLAANLLEQALRPMIAVPQVIFLTTFAILLGAWIPRARFVGVARLTRLSAFGEAALTVLLGVIGAQATLTEGILRAPVLLLIPLIVVVVHALTVLVGARLLGIDLASGIVVSVAAVGGAASAPAAAGALKAAHLIPAGVLLGSLGYALGTYLGVMTGMLLLP